MFRKYAIIAAALFLALSACSSDTSGEDEEKRGITGKVADQAVQSMRTPVDRAHDISDLTDEHNRELKEQQEELKQ